MELCVSNFTQLCVCVDVLRKLISVYIKIVVLRRTQRMYRVQVRISRNEYVNLVISLHPSITPSLTTLLSSFRSSSTEVVLSTLLPSFRFKPSDTEIEWHLSLTQAPHVDVEGKKVPGLPLVVEVIED